MTNVNRLGMFATLVMAACIIAAIALNIYSIYFTVINQQKPPLQLLAWTKGVMLTRGMITLMIHVAVAAWMARVARGASERPWLWGVFGFLFGLTAAALFCFVRVGMETQTAREARA